MRWFHGVVVLLAKKEEMGRMPSLATSCLTGLEERMLILKSKRNCKQHVPLDAVKVMTTMFPKIQKAIMPDMTRGAMSLPKTSLKNTVAMSRFSVNRSSTDTAHSFFMVSHVRNKWLLHLHMRY